MAATESAEFRGNAIVDGELVAKRVEHFALKLAFIVVAGSSFVTVAQRLDLRMDQDHSETSLAFLGQTLAVHS
jgi:hypothetical protein